MDAADHVLTDLDAIQRRAIGDSRAWFPDVHATKQSAVVHFALGIAGEVGELVNIVKKVNRGSASWDDVAVPIAHEMADVLIYLCDLATELGVDLATAVEDKREVLIERWGDPS